MAERITPVDERRLRAVVCAAAAACEDDRAATIGALVGAIAVFASASPTPNAVLTAAIDGLSEARSLLAALVGRPGSPPQEPS